LWLLLLLAIRCLLLQLMFVRSHKYCNEIKDNIQRRIGKVVVAAVAAEGQHKQLVDHYIEAVGVAVVVGIVVDKDFVVALVAGIVVDKDFAVDKVVVGIVDVDFVVAVAVAVAVVVAAAVVVVVVDDYNNQLVVELYVVAVAGFVAADQIVEVHHPVLKAFQAMISQDFEFVL
jgi:hypothetical protein